MGSNEWQDMPIAMDLPGLRWQVTLLGSHSEGRQPFRRITDVGETIRHDPPRGREQRDQQVGNAYPGPAAKSRALASAAKNPQCILRQELAVQPHYWLRGFARLRKHGRELKQKRVGIGTQHPAPVAYVPISYR